jgi:hypothetical protein
VPFERAGARFPIVAAAAIALNQPPGRTLATGGAAYLRSHAIFPSPAAASRGTRVQPPLQQNPPDANMLLYFDFEIASD